MWSSLVEILSKAILDGVQVDGIVLTTAVVAVPHRLGRRARGYICVGSTVATPLADENAGKADLDKYVYLKAGASTVASIWIF